MTRIINKRGDHFSLGDRIFHCFFVRRRPSSCHLWIVGTPWQPNARTAMFRILQWRIRTIWGACFLYSYRIVSILRSVIYNTVQGLSWQEMRRDDSLPPLKERRCCFYIISSSVRTAAHVRLGYRCHSQWREEWLCVDCNEAKQRAHKTGKTTPNVFEHVDERPWLVWRGTLTRQWVVLPAW